MATTMPTVPRAGLLAVAGLVDVVQCRGHGDVAAFGRVARNRHQHVVTVLPGAPFAVREVDRQVSRVLPDRIQHPVPPIAAITMAPITDSFRHGMAPLPLSGIVDTA
ncbi:hypothetical protein [Actinokineospora sp.]|uniref:hypothetical protein n=1 Tax=Actinokineospora sp. TaxID=1872133 RepID=UPI003D6A4EEC